jgi:phosphoglycolate phosphatase-like HAD superfamily hydrolase
MQKAYSLQSHEINQAQQLDEERKTVLAQIGALTLDMEAARAQLPIVEQRRRQHLQNLVQQHGVTEYRSARIEGPNLICDVPDEQPAQQIPQLGRTNGLEVLAKE